MEMGDKMEILPSPQKPQGLGRLIFVIVILSSVMSLLALVLSAVSLSNKGTTNINVPQQQNAAVSSGSGMPTVSASDKIWTFAIGHDGTNLEYIDDTSGILRGFHVDIVNSVCKVANKDCRLVWDLYNKCWDSQPGELPRGGMGLMDSWYDGCTGWFGTYERSRTFQFTDAFRKPFNAVFWVKVGNPGSFNPSDITSKTIGFLDGDSCDEHCMSRNSDTITGANLPVGQIKHYVTPALLNDAIVSGQVDAGFANNNILSLHTGLVKIGDEISNCVIQGGSIMMRKDSSLGLWWNPAFALLKERAQYTKICNNINRSHGDRPGGDVSVICF